MSTVVRRRVRRRKRSASDPLEPGRRGRSVDAGKTAVVIFATGILTMLAVVACAVGALDVSVSLSGDGTVRAVNEGDQRVNDFHLVAGPSATAGRPAFSPGDAVMVPAPGGSWEPVLIVGQRDGAPWPGFRIVWPR